MIVRNSVCAFVLAAAMASPVLAQQPSHPFYNPSPESGPTPSLEIGRGPVAFQSTRQQRRVYEVMPRIEKAVSAELDNPGLVELRGLRTGRYQKAMVVCGLVENTGATGETEKRRFIARTSIATLETPANSEAFKIGWRKTGCGL